jgi:hypothetical protein
LVGHGAHPWHANHHFARGGQGHAEDEQQHQSGA